MASSPHDQQRSPEAADPVAAPVEEARAIVPGASLQSAVRQRKIAGRLAQRRASAGGEAPAGAGSPLPDPVRGKMEQSFGQDFSSVRVHEGARAGAMNAVAYAEGQDLHFAPGSYNPGSRSGQELIGHELTHVVQQGAGRAAVPQGKEAPVNDDPALEHEADTLGARAAAGERVEVPGASRADGGGAQRKASGGVVQRMVVVDDDGREQAELTIPAKFYAGKQGDEIKKMVPGLSFQGLKKGETLYFFGHGSEGAVGAPILLSYLNHSKTGIADDWEGTIYLGYCFAGVEASGFSSLVSAVAGGLKNKKVKVEGVRGMALSQYGDQEHNKKEVIAERTVKEKYSKLFRPPGSNKKQQAEAVRGYVKELFDAERGPVFAEKFIALQYSDDVEMDFHEANAKAIALADEYGILFRADDVEQTQKVESLGFGDWDKREPDDKQAMLKSLDDLGLRKLIAGFGDLKLNEKVEEATHVFKAKKLPEKIPPLEEDAKAAEKILRERDGKLAKEESAVLPSRLLKARNELAAAGEAYAEGAGDLHLACTHWSSAGNELDATFDLLVALLSDLRDHPEMEAHQEEIGLESAAMGEAKDRADYLKTRPMQLHEKWRAAVARTLVEHKVGAKK